jgi:hypothetical protein
MKPFHALKPYFLAFHFNIITPVYPIILPFYTIHKGKTTTLPTRGILGMMYIPSFKKFYQLRPLIKIYVSVTGE